MGALLYHVPGASAPVTKDHLRQWGLAGLFDGVPYHADARGPAGAGVLLTDAVALDPYQPVYRPDEQDWSPRPEKYGPPVHVGFYRAAPRATAANLDRADPLSGERVQLADGAWWLVPRVRSVTPEGDAFSPLPSYVELDDDGRPRRGAIDERYAALWEATTVYWEAFLAAADSLSPRAETIDVAVPDDYVFDVAATLLAANYRVDAMACSRLRLFQTTGHMGAVLWAACDCEWALAQLLQKKSGRSGSAT